MQLKLLKKEFEVNLLPGYNGFMMNLGIIAATLLLSAHADLTTRPGTPPVDNGADKFTPTKCEWLALELNANYRENNAKDGYASHFYCRPPSTIFLSFHYSSDSSKAAATQAADNVREVIGRVFRERSWRWVKVEEEIVKDVPAETKSKSKSSTEATSPEPVKGDGMKAHEEGVSHDTPNHSSVKSVTAPEKLPEVAPETSPEAAQQPVAPQQKSKSTPEIESTNID